MTGSLYIRVNDIGYLWKRLKDRVKVSCPIETFDYGMREFAIEDCNNYLIQFGQDVETIA